MEIKKKIGEWCGKKETLFRTLLGNWVRPNDSLLLGDNDTIPDSVKLSRTIISEEQLTMGGYRAKFKRINVWFAYRLFKPVVWLSYAFLNKFLVKRIQDAPYNKNLLIFSDVIEKSLQDWHYVYQNNSITRKENQVKYGKYIDPKYGAHNMVKALKQLYLTLISADTAYRELHNIIMYNVAIAMNNGYSGETAHHLLYKHAPINDVNYFAIEGTMENNVLVQFKDKATGEMKYLAVNKKYAYVLDQVPKDYSVLNGGELKNGKR